MRHRSLVVLIALITSMGLFSCNTSKFPQGIKGRIRWIEGNQMPMISENSNSKIIRPQGVIRNLLIFPQIHSQDIKIQDGLILLMDQIPVDSTWSKKNGKFKIRLPEGKYSLLTQEADGLFGNYYDAQGFLSPVTVSKNGWQKVEILINYKATY